MEAIRTDNGKEYKLVTGGVIRHAKEQIRITIHPNGETFDQIEKTFGNPDNVDRLEMIDMDNEISDVVTGYSEMVSIQKIKNYVIARTEVINDDGERIYEDVTAEVFVIIMKKPGVESQVNKINKKMETIERAAMFSAIMFTDEQALEVQELYPIWSKLSEGTLLTKVDEATKGTEITRVRGDDGKLYRVEKTHRKQSDWAPGQETAALFTVIDVEHDGTLENPIPASVNMEYIKGKYYIEDGKVYLMNRTGMEDGEGVVLQYLPSQLLGQYFESVEV